MFDTGSQATISFIPQYANKNSFQHPSAFDIKSQYQNQQFFDVKAKMRIFGCFEL